MKRRRGSALIFVIGMLFATAIILMATANVSMSSERKFQSDFRQSKEENYVKGVESWMTSEAAANSIAMNTDVSLTQNGVTYGARVASTANPRIYQVTNPSMAARMNFNVKIAGRQPSHPVYYAVWTGGVLGSNTAELSVPAANGSIHSNSNVRVAITSEIGGDITAGGTIGAIGNVGGNRKDSAQTQTFPSFSLSDYDAVDSYDSFGSSQNGLLFLSFSTPYPVYVSRNPLTISGGYTGKGTVFVNGDLTLSGNSTYVGGAASRVVFIVMGDLVIDSGCTSFVGTYIVSGKITVNGTATRALTRGNLITAINFEPGNARFEVTTDRSFWDDRSQAEHHRVPGFWPSCWPGLMR